MVCNENITDSRGNGPGFYQLGVPEVMVFSELQDKSQSPRFFPGLGGQGGVVTND